VKTGKYLDEMSNFELVKECPASWDYWRQMLETGLTVAERM
jgi:hypothetical protein